MLGRPGAVAASGWYSAAAAALDVRQPGVLRWQRGTGRAGRRAGPMASPRGLAPGVGAAPTARPACAQEARASALEAGAMAGPSHHMHAAASAPRDDPWASDAPGARVDRRLSVRPRPHRDAPAGGDGHGRVHGGGAGHRSRHLVASAARAGGLGASGRQPRHTQFLRSDHGPECIALAVRGWLARPQMAMLYIAPGSPWQHGYGERFNSIVRDECLNMPVFHSVAEARVVLAIYRRHYNAERPHSSLSYRTPAEFKRAWLERLL